MLGDFAQISALQYKSDKPMNVVVTGVGQRTQRMLAKKLAMKWALTFKETKLEKLIENQKVVYLSPDAIEVMTEFNPL